MTEQRPYQRSFGNPPDGYQKRSNYTNRSYSRNDTGKFFDQERDDSRKQYSFDRDRGYKKNQDEKDSFNYNRMYSERNEKNNSNNRNRQYSTQDNSRYRSNQQTYGSSSSNRNLQTEQEYCQVQDDDMSHSVKQGKEYSVDKDGDNYSNRNKQRYTQDSSRYRSNQQTYGSSSSNSNLYKEQQYCQDQDDDMSHSVRQRQEYSVDKDGYHYSNRSRQCSPQDSSRYRSNQETYWPSSSNSNLYKEQQYCQDQYDDLSHSVRQSREYSLDKDGGSYSNRNIQYSTEDSSRYKSNQNFDGSSSSNRNLFKGQSYCQDVDNDFSHSLRQSREYSLDKGWDNYSNRSIQCSNQDNSEYGSCKKTHSLSASNNYVYKEQQFCGYQAEDLFNSQSREYSLNNDEESYLSRSTQHLSQDNFDFRSNQQPFGSPAAKNSTYTEPSNIHNRDSIVSQKPQISRFCLGNPQTEEIQNLQPREYGDKFRHVKRARQSIVNKTFSSGNRFKQFKREQNDGEYNAKEIQNYNKIKVPTDVKNEIEIEEVEDDYDGYHNEEICNKVNSFIPDKKLIEKYKYFPPSAEEMKKLFNGLVIYFFYKIKDVPEKNPFVVICESFRRSDRFEPLSVEDGYQLGNKYTKYCTLRWHGMMMVRGVGYDGKFKEPRIVAGVELINQLAMSCYTVKMKDSHYGKAALDNFLIGNKSSNIMRFVQSHEAQDMDSARTFITNFFKDDNDCELIFKDIAYVSKLKSWAKSEGYDVRSSIKTNVFGVSVRRTPQYWRDSILASGKMENERFILLPPQGYGNELMKNPIFSDYQRGDPRANGPSTIYAHNNAGLKISTCKPPWQKTGGGGMSKNNKDKMTKIKKALKEGDILKVNQTFRFLRKKTKQTIKKRLGLTQANVRNRI